MIRNHHASLWLAQHSVHRLVTVLLVCVCAQKVRRQKESLHFIGLPAQNKHTVFVEAKEEAKRFVAAEVGGWVTGRVGMWSCGVL